MLVYSVGTAGFWPCEVVSQTPSLLPYLCAKVIIIVASQQLHPNVGFASVRIVDRVVSVIGYSIRREAILPSYSWLNA